MTDLEKLVTIAGGQEKIYDAGVLKFGLAKTTEKSEFVSVPDSSDYKVLGLEMEGKTEQKQYEGKNLFDLASTNGFVSQYSGLSTEIDIENNSFTTTNSHMTQRTGHLDLGILQAGTYYLSFENVNGYSAAPSIDYGELGALTRIAGIPNTGGSFTIDEELHIWVVTVVNTDTPLKWANIQLELGNTATSYEPYVGGIPSPSPSYPQEIVNGGKTKNLFDISKIETNATLTNNGDGSLTVRHASNTAPVNLRDVAPSLVVGETYTLSANSTGADKYFIVNGVLMKFGENFTVTEEMLNNPIRLYSSYNTNGGSTTDTAVISDIQIELGETATEYESYGTYKVECTAVNKNLWDAEYASDRNNWVLYTASAYPSIKIPVPKYTKISMSYKNALSTGVGIHVCVSRNGDHNGGNFGWLYHNTASSLINNQLTFNTASNDYIYVHCSSVQYDYTGSLENFIQNIGNDLQIEVSDTATDYQPHQTKQFTLTSDRPITKWDKLVKRDGVWGWSVNHLHYVIDETVTMRADADRMGFTITSILLPAKANRKEFYSNQFWYKDDYNASNLRRNSLYLGLNNTLIYLCNNDYFDSTLSDSGLANWKAHLAENPLEIWTYADEEQSFIPLPDSEQAILNKLTTYPGGTNIYTDQGMPISIEYIVNPDIYSQGGDA